MHQSEEGNIKNQDDHSQHININKFELKIDNFELITVVTPNNHAK